MNNQQHSYKNLPIQQKPRLAMKRFVQISAVALVALFLVGSILFFATQKNTPVAAASLGQQTMTTTNGTSLDGVTPTPTSTTSTNGTSTPTSTTPTNGTSPDNVAPTPTTTNTQSGTGTNSPTGNVESNICTPTAPQAIELTVANSGNPVLDYLIGQGGYQTAPMNTSIVAYDLAHHSKQTLVRSNQGANIVNMAVSPNKRWILVDVKLGVSTTGERIQLMSADGHLRVTLLETCDSPISSMTSFTWSPDSTKIAYTNSDFTQLNVLDLTTGRIQTALTSDSTLAAIHNVGWASQQQIVVSYQTDTTTHLYTLDLSKGSNQAFSSLHEVASLPTACGNVVVGDGTLYLASCNGSQGGNNCQGNIVQGSSTITAVSVNTGAKKTIYSSASNAVIALSVSQTSVSFWVLNVTGDASQSGLWSINMDGTNVRHLSTTTVSPCIYSQSATPEWQVASNDQSVAALSVIPGSPEQQVLSVSDGNGQTTISTAQVGGVNNVFAIAFGSI